ncbi:nucleoside 2-deoxyribosyltransferase [Geomicrobium sp. JSM 1781026]|uniref:nucleoside 2-deoxyribosyltransferase n=1 Tax=Geomicrobium sp. JSM 1781026 TaxID=3344580 RepID=UPI0035C25C2E
MNSNCRKLKLPRTFCVGKDFGCLVPREHQNEQFEFGSLEWRSVTFDDDRVAIRYADAVVAIYDEQDPGTMWEIGYAYSHEKPIIILHTISEPVNIMITESLHAYLRSFKELQMYSFKQLRTIPYRGEVT